jgi:hypothetical protein
MVDSHRDLLGRARQLAQALAAQEPQFAHRVWLVPDLVVVGKLTLSAGLPACAAISRSRKACIAHIRSCTLVMQWHRSNTANVGSDCKRAPAAFAVPVARRAALARKRCG